MAYHFAYAFCSSCRHEFSIAGVGLRSGARNLASVLNLTYDIQLYAIQPGVGLLVFMPRKLVSLVVSTERRKF